MNYYKCRSCAKEFLVKRDFCPSCYSQDIEQVDLKSGVVIYSVKLIATPENFPDQYYLVIAKFSNFSFFCRSENSLLSGTKITILDDGNGPVCSPSI
jgi:uncharacterized OB-fold protein